jgi:hypothetical protein
MLRTYPFILLLCSLSGFSQNLSSVGNYAGIASVGNNPSSIVFSKLQYEINLVNVNVSAFNNTLYLDYLNDYEVNREIIKRTRIFAGADISGPGFLLVKMTKAFAITTAVKTLACTNGISGQTSEMIYNASKNNPTNGLTIGLIDGKQFNAISYGEMAISFAKITRNNGSRMVSIGYTGKILMGFAGVSFIATNSKQIDTGEFPITTSDMQYAYAMPVPGDEHPVRVRGIGVGSDIGFTYLKKRFSKPKHRGCPSVIKRYLPANDYAWKLGISILDIGGILFQNESHVRQLKGLNNTLDTLQLKSIGNPYKLDSLLLSHSADSSARGKQSSFYMGLPTTLVLQLDEHLAGRFFIHYYITQRLITDNGIRMFRANQLSVSPRFETANWEVGVKAGAIEYRFPILGAAIRYKSFRIGADYISDLSFTSIYGVQLNVGLSIHAIQGKYMPKMRF